MAEFRFLHGPMGAGKGVYIAQFAHNVRRRDREVAMIKPGSDEKGGENIVSRVGTSVATDLLAWTTNEAKSTIENNLREDLHQLMSERGVRFSRVITDETQFFTPDQVTQLYEIAKVDDIPVVSFGLRVDVYRRLFAGTQRLFELADQSIELQHDLLCACGERPMFNGRFIDGVFDTNIDGPQQIIEGSAANVTYDVFCPGCYDKAEAGAKALQA